MNKSLYSILILSVVFMSACSNNSDSDSSSEISDISTQITETETETASEEENTAIGTWIFGNDTDFANPSELIIESSDEAYYKIYLDQTEQFKIDSDNNFYFNGVLVPESDYSFENNVFRLTHDDIVAIEMEKTDGSDEKTGEYTLKDCWYKDRITNYDYGTFDVSDDSFSIIMHENNTVLSVKMKMNDFKLTDDTISSEILIGDEKASVHYEVDGDTLIVTPDGKRNEFIRKK